MHTTVVRSSKEKHILRGRWQLNKSLPQAFRTPHPQLSSKTASLPGVKHCQYKRWNCSQDLLDQWVGATDPKSLAKGIKRLYEWLHSLTTDLAYNTYTLFNSKQSNGNVAHISLCVPSWRLTLSFSQLQGDACFNVEVLKHVSFQFRNIVMFCVCLLCIRCTGFVGEWEGEGYCNVKPYVEHDFGCCLKNWNAKGFDILMDEQKIWYMRKVQDLWTNRRK